MEIKRIAGRRHTVVVEISPLTLCNKRCSHCFISDEQLADKTVMDFNSLGKLISIVKKFVDKATSELDDRTFSFDTTVLGGELLLMSLENNLKLIDYSSDLAEYFLNKDNFTTSEVEYATNLIFPKSRDKNFDVIIDRIESINNNHKEHLIRLSSSFEPDTGRFSNLRDFERFISNANKVKEKNITSIVIATTTNRLTEMNPVSLNTFFNVRCGFDIAIYDMLHGFGHGRKNEYLHPDWEQYNNFILAQLATDKVNGTEVCSSYELRDKGGSYVEDKVGVPVIFVGITSAGITFVFNDNAECAFNGHIDIEDVLSLTEEEAVERLFVTWIDYLKQVHRRALKIKNCINCDIVEYCHAGFYGNVYGFGNEKEVYGRYGKSHERCPIYDSLSAYVNPEKVKDFVRLNKGDYDKFFKLNIDSETLSKMTNKDIYKAFIDQSK